MEFCSNGDGKTVPSRAKTTPQSRPADFHIWASSHASDQVVAVTGRDWPFLDGISPPPTLHLHDNSMEKASRPGDSCPARRGASAMAASAMAASALGYLEVWPVNTGPESIRMGHKAEPMLTAAAPLGADHEARPEG